MTYEKLTNTLSASLGRHQRKKISLKHLRYLFTHYKVEEICIYNYCCYGEDVACWYDVEGTDHGWLFLDHTKEEMPSILLKYVKGHMHGHMDSLYKRRAFITQKDNLLTYVIPMRDLAKYDIYITFNLVEDKSNQNSLWWFGF